MMVTKDVKLLLSILAVASLAAIHLLSDPVLYGAADRGLHQTDADDTAASPAVGTEVSPLGMKEEDTARNVKDINRSNVHFKQPAFKKHFPFHATASDHCVTRQEVVALSSMVRTLLQNNIRVFPRNGFLLGIVRHGGYLPNEHLDADMGIVHRDLDPYLRHLLNPNAPKSKGEFNVAGYAFKLNPTQDYWENWRGIDPVTREPYPFFGVDIRRGRVDVNAISVYEYGSTRRYFLPWLTIFRRNHEASVADSMRYNEEGGNLRLLETDEPLDRSNYRKEAQLGVVYPSDLTCFVETQFYHTTIPVPCDYKGILTSTFGENWKHVEKRGDISQADGREQKFESLRVSEDANEMLLWGGPRPICATSSTSQ